MCEPIRRSSIRTVLRFRRAFASHNCRRGCVGTHSIPSFLMKNIAPTPPSSTAAAITLLNATNGGYLTPFQRKVYSALCSVPPGQVTTYQNLARAIDCHSNQAVGQALRRNPWGPHVPCHRVVRTDLTLGGFGGTIAGEKIDRKMRMLEKEGVRFQEDGKVDPKCIFQFDSSN